MTVLKLTGQVQLGDAYRVDRDELDGAVHIGGVDVLKAVGEAFLDGRDNGTIPKVTVAIADERFTGDLEYEYGWGYSDYTPMDPDELNVGPHNIIDYLTKLEGQTITLWVADEPFNTLEET
jgi:hypothetical protein